MVDPVTIGKIQCIDTVKQCYFGESPFTLLSKDDIKKTKFEKECDIKKGFMVRCCQPDLVNISYSPKPKDIPVHVQLKSHGQYEVCPESIQSKCYRETDANKPLCIQNACNDAGYRLANNYYELCKSIQLDENTTEIPDCLINGCWGDRFRVGNETEKTSAQLLVDRKNLLDQVKEINSKLKNVKKVSSELQLKNDKSNNLNNKKLLQREMDTSNIKDQIIIESFNNDINSNLTFDNKLSKRYAYTFEEKIKCLLIITLLLLIIKIVIININY